MSKIKVWVHGATGRMGHEVLSAIVPNHPKFEAIGGSGDNFIGKYVDGTLACDSRLSLVDCLKQVEVVIDFSSPAGNQLLYDNIASREFSKLSVLIATTGLSLAATQKWSAISEAKGLQVLFAPNTSLGVLLTVKSSLMLASVLHKNGFDIEITESHHKNKVDTPSGTAKFLAEQMAQKAHLELNYARTGKRKENEIGVSAIRGGAIIGEHTIHFLGDSEEIHITHRALSRSLFATGALVLSKWLHEKKPNFYTLEDVNIEDLL